MEKKWVLPQAVPSTQTDLLSKTLNINTTLSQLLLQRGIDSFEKAKEFFRPKLEGLHDPFLMKGMERAVNRLSEAIFQDEKVMVYGDYDVDGTTSVALVYDFLTEFAKPNTLSYYVPDRYTEGYGLSAQGVRMAAEQGVTLLITLDCGIKANTNAQLARELGIDLIVCDHHLPGPELPSAYAILDPKQSDCPYPYKELSGCGVGFKLLHGFCLQNTVPLSKLYNYLDLVATSIACDIVPITGENRVMAHYGIRKINKSPLPGIRALIEVSGLRGEITVSDLVFYIGPRINATGRLTHARRSVEMLITRDPDNLKAFSQEMNLVNGERKTYDMETTEDALEMIREDPPSIDRKSTVLFREDWNKGIVGIVASRCIESYHRPTIILTASNGKATGSARSVPGFDIYGAIEQCRDLLDQFGGHHHAAGLSMSLDNIEAFQQKFEEVVSSTITEDQLQPKLYADLEVEFSFINFKCYDILRQMAPFGPQNPKPVFVTRNVSLKSHRVIKDKHLKLSLTQNNARTYEAIAFGMGPLAEEFQDGTALDIAYHLDENEYMGNKTLQLIVKDIKLVRQETVVG